jgi:hypothetical protein
LAGLSALLVALFEFSLGVWLIVKGFNPSAITSDFPEMERSELVSAA